MAALPGSAAATLHVDNLAGPSSPTCGASADPCHRIQDAVVRARVATFPGRDEIRAASGSYPEDVDLTNAADSGDRIVGAGTSGIFSTTSSTPPPRRPRTVRR